MAEHDPRTAKDHAAMRARGMRLRQIRVLDLTNSSIRARVRAEAMRINAIEQERDLTWLDDLAAEAWKDEPDYRR